MYKVAVSDDADLTRLDKEAIKTWIKRLIFAILPPGCTKPLLYTPASMSRLAWAHYQSKLIDKQLCRVLVPIIPSGVKVKLSTLQQICDEDGAHHEMQRDLRWDILQMCHSFTSPHLSKARTLQAVREIAWWPNVVEQTAYFVETCETCMATTDSMQYLGCSNTADRRFAAIIIDKIKFSKQMSAIIQCPAALLATCAQIGDHTVALCNNMSAIEAARLIFVHVIPKYGVPMVVISDSESAFAADVTQALCRMMGVQEWDFGAVSHPEHHGKIERRVAPYKRAIEEAAAKGQITSREEMEIVLAKVQIQQDQLIYMHGTTAFQRRTGSIPRTFKDLVSSVTKPDFELKDYTTQDRRVIDALAQYVFDTAEWHQQKSEDINRTGLFPKLKKLAQSNKTQFVLLPGDKVSYKGLTWTLIDLGGQPDMPVTALIQRVDHSNLPVTKKVAYDSLRGLASLRETLEMPKEWDLKVGQLTFFLLDTLVKAACIVKLKKDTFVAQEYSTVGTGISYLPLWTDGTSTERRKTKPAGHEQVLHTVHKDQLQLVTQLDKHYKLTKQAINQLRALGIMEAEAADEDESHSSVAAATLMTSISCTDMPSALIFDDNHTEDPAIINLTSLSSDSDEEGYMFVDTMVTSTVPLKQQYKSLHRCPPPSPTLHGEHLSFQPQLSPSLQQELETALTIFAAVVTSCAVLTHEPTALIHKVQQYHHLVLSQQVLSPQDLVRAIARTAHCTEDASYVSVNVVTAVSLENDASPPQVSKHSSHDMAVVKSLYELHKFYYGYTSKLQGTSPDACLSQMLRLPIFAQSNPKQILQEAEERMLLLEQRKTYQSYHYDYSPLPTSDSSPTPNTMSHKLTRGHTE